MWVMEPASCALKDRTILKDEETIWTTPSVDPRKRFEEPVHRDERSDYAIHTLEFRIEAGFLSSRGGGIHQRQLSSPPTA